MSDKDFEEFLTSIGGLENGYFNDREPIKSRYICEHDNGWLPLVKDLIEKLINIGWDKKVCQIKEKYGGLRFYINSGSDEMYKLISEAEDLSYNTCEVCGKPGTLNDKKWLKTTCKDHNT